MKRALWVWCYVAYKLYLWLPVSSTHKSLYGQFTLWLLGYGGAYAHSEDYKWFCENAFIHR